MQRAAGAHAGSPAARGAESAAAPAAPSVAPPPRAAQGGATLITIPISHYCEKARWALDRADVRYAEQRHVQGVHRIVARRAGGGHTVPVLLTGGQVIGESEEILRWVDERVPEQQRLFASTPAESAAELALCRRFDERLGPHGRRLIYVHMLRQRDLAMPFNNQGVPRWEADVMRFGWPLITRFISRVLQITPGVEADDEAVVTAEFDRVAQLLGDGRPYLCGERFGAADLTFAALAASVLAPPQYGVRLPQPDELPDATASLVRRFREHPAGEFAMQLFARHRARGALAS
jgi:glutathione S-transferase